MRPLPLSARLLAFALAACHDPAVPPNPNTAPDAAVSLQDPCIGAERNLLALQCKDERGRLIGGPNLHDVPYRTVCRDNADNGADMKPRCVLAAKSCKEINGCQ